MPDTFLAIDNLKSFYGDFQALHGLSLSLGKGEVLALIGANGAGKSTLLKSIAGLVTEKTGVISWKGQDISGRAMSNLLVSLTHGNSLLTDTIYDNDYRLATLRVYDSGSGTYPSRLLYSYGDGLNLTFINDFVAPANSVRLSYTAANRLGSATGPWGVASYTYDAVGNRLTHVVTSGTTTTRLASYGTTNNRILGMTENAAALRSYTYDGYGNILTDTRSGEVFSFSYNKRNRPLAVARNAVVYASYEYDAHEQLVSRSTSAPGGPSGIVHYIHDLAGHVIAEADGATGTTTKRDPRILPETVIYDPDLSRGLPPAIAAASGMNAIAHGVEALYAKDRNPLTMLMAEEGIRALGQGLPSGDPSRSLYGAYLCGAVLGVSTMALHHKLCHVLGGSFNLPHAETHTVMLPHATAYNASAAPDAMARIAKALGSGTAARGLQDLGLSLHAPTSLKALGLAEADLDRAADLAMANAYWNPRPLTRDGIRQLLDDAFHGTPIDA